MPINLNIQRSNQIFKYVSDNLPGHTITKLSSKEGSDAYKAEVFNNDSAYMIVFRFDNETIAGVEKITLIVGDTGAHDNKSAISGELYKWPE